MRTDSFRWTPKDIITTILAMAAFSISVFSLYRNEWRIDNSLRIRYVGTPGTVAILPPDRTIAEPMTFNVVFINSGNRDAVVEEADLRLQEHERNYSHALSDSTDDTSFLLEPGKIRLLRLRWNLDTKAPSEYRDGGPVYLHVVASNASGAHDERVIQIGELVLKDATAKGATVPDASAVTPKDGKEYWYHTRPFDIDVFRQ